MADSKLNDMTELTAANVVDTDLIYVVHDPGGTPVDRKVKISSLPGPHRFKQTIYRGGSNIGPTTSSSFIDIDATNIPALGLTLAVNDVVKLELIAGFAWSGIGNIFAIDWLIDQPVSADTNVRGSYYAAWYWEIPSTGKDDTVITATAYFVATEAGAHTFKPQWKASAGSMTLILTGTYSSPVFHTVTNLGQPAP